MKTGEQRGGQGPPRWAGASGQAGQCGRGDGAPRRRVRRPPAAPPPTGCAAPQWCEGGQGVTRAGGVLAPPGEGGCARVARGGARRGEGSGAAVRGRAQGGRRRGAPPRRVDRGAPTAAGGRGPTNTPLARTAPRQARAQARRRAGGGGWAPAPGGRDAVAAVRGPRPRPRSAPAPSTCWPDPLAGCQQRGCPRASPGAATAPPTWPALLVSGGEGAVFGGGGRQMCVTHLAPHRGPPTVCRGGERPAHFRTPHALSHRLGEAGTLQMGRGLRMRASNGWGGAQGRVALAEEGQAHMGTGQLGGPRATRAQVNPVCCL